MIILFILAERKLPSGQRQRIDVNEDGSIASISSSMG